MSEIEVLDLRESKFLVRPLLAERQRHLPDFVRMKGLLQVEQLVLGRNPAADFQRIDVRIGGADDDLDLRVDLADSARRPGSVWTGWHAHVEKDDGERTPRATGLAHGSDGGLRAVAEHGFELIPLRHGTGGSRCTGAGDEEFRPQFIHGLPVGTAAGGFAEHLAIGVQHGLLVVDDQHADRLTVVGSHQQPQAAWAAGTACA